MVTGASAGIGRAIAVAFAALIDREIDKISKVLAKAGAAAPQ